MSLRWITQCSSTQDELWNAPATVTAVATTRQTAGRGRRGRVWQHTPDTGLALSWRAPTQDLQVESLPMLSLAAGVALHQWVTKLLTEPPNYKLLKEDTSPWPTALALKWPNDLLYHQQKLAGILCEARLRGDIEHRTSQNPTVVIGIGINISAAPIIDSLAVQPTHLNLIKHDLNQSSLSVPQVSQEIETLMTLLHAQVDQLRDHPRLLLDEWRRRGLPLNTPLKTGERVGTYQGINQQGALLLDINGSLCTVEAGEVALCTSTSPTSD